MGPARNHPPSSRAVVVVAVVVVVVVLLLLLPTLCFFSFSSLMLSRWLDLFQVFPPARSKHCPNTNTSSHTRKQHTKQITQAT